MHNSILHTLLKATWENPVFGDTFSAQTPEKTKKVLGQIEAIMDDASQALGRSIAAGMPQLAPETVKKIVSQIAPKTVGFCPALIAGELDDPARLKAVAIAIALMYWGDQTMDRGDEAMPFAIEQFGGQISVAPAGLHAVVATQAQALQGIIEAINDFAQPQDAPFVIACFREQVLLREARLHRLSEQFLQTNDKSNFLVHHGSEIAHIITVTAGLPSVASSLYAIYRQHDTSLPTLADVYAEPALFELLQVCNAVVRMADELGDRDTDAGHHPEWGVFTINLFNQGHPALVTPFLDLARITDAKKVQKLQQLFAQFYAQHGGLEQAGNQVMDLFFDHIRHYMAHLPPFVQHRYSLYINICKRVLEIGHVNKVGDIALAGAQPA